MGRLINYAVLSKSIDWKSITEIQILLLYTRYTGIKLCCFIQIQTCEDFIEIQIVLLLTKSNGGRPDIISNCVDLTESNEWNIYGNSNCVDLIKSDDRRPYINSNSAALTKSNDGKTF